MTKFLILLLLIPFRLFSQEIICDNTDIEDAYKLALNTVNINIRRGILAAGGDYGGEWTRDCAINSWNAAGILDPEVAERSLWEVTVNKNTVGHQYWDRIIWVIAALNHYRATGDQNFLMQAYQCSANSMKELEQEAFDTQYGLFTGPSVFNDGIAGYPEPVFDKTNHSSFVLDYENSKNIKCLSTNCVYYGAYLALIQMGQLLNIDNAQIRVYQKKAKNLGNSILKYFYSEKENKLCYLIDGNGNINEFQEGLGISFAIMFGILNKDQAERMIRHVHVSKYGITSIYPDFPRFSPDKPGRHNNIIWPMVNGFFAQASIIAGDTVSFVHELNGLTHLALDKDKGNYQFWEVYNPYTGLPDGGWQVGRHWDSCRLQTWSATAYLNMVNCGLLGIRLLNHGISFSPFLPAGIHYLELKGVTYRQSKLNITIKGHGEKVKSFFLNGKAQSDNSIDAGLKGDNDIVIELG